MAENPRGPRFPYFILTAVVLAGVAGVLVIASTAVRASDRLVQAEAGHAWIVEQQREILLCDEVLTMSARQGVAERLFAFEGGEAGARAAERAEEYWQRYADYEAKLDRHLSLVGSIVFFSHRLRRGLNQTSDANQLLIDFEHAGRDAVDRAALEEARARLAGRRYGRLKRAYSSGMNIVMSGIRAYFVGAAEAQTAIASRAWVGAVAIGLALPLSWLWALWALMSWRRHLTAARHDAERARVALDDAIAAARLGVFTVWPDGSVEASLRSARLLGITPPRTIDDLLAGLAPEARATVAGQLRDALDGDAPHRTPGAAVPLDGRDEWVDISWRRGRRGDRRALFGLVRDDTRGQRDKVRLEDRAEANAELARTRQTENSMLLRELLRAEQQERDRLGSQVHDGLQQNIVVARMYAALARDALMADPPRVADALASLLKCIAELDRSAQAVRDVHLVLRRPPLEETGLGAALEDLVVRSPLDVSLTLRPSADGLLGLRSDVRELAWRAVRELLLNVKKYAGVSQASVDAGLVGDTLRVQVSDAGAGFDAARASRGTGLDDLRRRASAIGGRLDVESTPGGGTRVVLVVPEAGPDRRMISSMPPARPPARLDGALRVLVADDNVPMGQHTLRVLSNDGRFEVVAVVTSGADAVAAALALDPDAMVVDFSMPDLDGDQIIARVLEALPQVRAVGYTCSPDEARAAMTRAGAVAVIDKSEDPSCLIAALLGDDPDAG